MEYIDIIDQEGKKTGESRPIPEVHQKGLWHRTVHVWCVNSKGEILLQRRAKNKENFPDMWDISAAGHISSGEGSIDAALRETKEEIGVDLSPSDLMSLGEIKHQGVLNGGTYIDNEISDIYLVRLNSELSDFKMQEEEVSALKWIPIVEFKKWVMEERADVVPHAEEFELLFRMV